MQFNFGAAEESGSSTREPAAANDIAAALRGSQTFPGSRRGRPEKKAVGWASNGAAALEAGALLGEGSNGFATASGLGKAHAASIPSLLQDLQDDWNAPHILLAWRSKPCLRPCHLSSRCVRIKVELGSKQLMT
eukprot:scaffold40_cov305-Pinguiococcus_pyrenoidosus.AAC.35